MFERTTIVYLKWKSMDGIRFAWMDNVELFLEFAIVSKLAISGACSPVVDCS